MLIWIRMAVREIKVNKGFSIFFVLNLAMGLAGFIGVQSFGRSLDRHLDKNLQEILTADLVLSASSPMAPEESALAATIMGRDVKRARLVAFYTMVRPGGSGDSNLQARLVRVMAIDKAYPLYGQFVMENNTLSPMIQKSPSLFMTRDTAHTLGVETDQRIPLRIGNKDFYVQDFFAEDPDKSLTAVDLAPKVYMGMDQLDGTGLIQFGSRIRYFYFYTFPQGTDVQALTRRLDSAFFDLSNGRPRINIFDTRDVNRQLGRVTEYFTGYLGLVGIVALFLAGLSGAYLFRGLVGLKQKEMAILSGLGAVSKEIYLFVSIQLVILGSLAAVLAVGISRLLLPAFPMIFKGLVPDGLIISMDPATVFLALGLGMGGSLVFCLPVFARLFTIRPGDLLQGINNGRGQNRGNASTALTMFAFLPGLIAFFLVSAIVAGSIKEGLIFALGFVVAMVLLSFTGSIVFQWCRYLSKRKMLGISGKIAFRNLFRNKWSSLSCFVTIAMGVFLISLIPQIQKGLASEIMRPEGLKLPVFFLVDIQDEQKNALEDFMAKQNGELSHISPMVRGRILKVNGHLFFDKSKRTGERNRPGRMGGRRLEFMFSYRKALADSETLVQGVPLTPTPWSFDDGIPFEISMAVSFADRHGFRIGDVLTFDVQGIPLEGKVKNLRKVRWNSFQPNFFMLFQDGVLNDAPKTHLGAVSNVPPDQRKILKNLLVDEFPNISVIDVTQTASTILGVTDRLSLSVRFMAWLAIGAGLVSIFSIARHEARKNRNQINLLKVLGCDFKTLQAVSLVEFGFIGFLASIFALALSMGFSLVISWYFFDSLWKFDSVYLFGILVSATGLCMVTGLAAARQVMKKRPLALLGKS